VCFVIGSALFAAGVLIDVLTTQVELAAWTFFIGSVFFTTAAALQLLSSREHLAVSHADPVRQRLAARARNLDWTAAATQFVGTLLFNVSTFRAAALGDLTVAQENQLVWAPDGLGSILFLVSSGLAFIPEVRERRHAHARSRSWTMAALNLLGSVFFGLSALGAYTLPDTGELGNVRWANLGTFLGAVCFLVAAALLTRAVDHRDVAERARRCGVPGHIYRLSRDMLIAR
jgi:hypothetical protein